MGNWNIDIKGHGIHHNGLPGDADAVGRDAIAKLRAAGSEVSSATLTLTNPDGTPVTADGVTDLLAE